MKTKRQNQENENPFTAKFKGLQKKIQVGDFCEEYHNLSDAAKEELLEIVRINGGSINDVMFFVDLYTLADVEQEEIQELYKTAYPHYTFIYFEP